MAPELPVLLLLLLFKATPGSAQDFLMALSSEIKLGFHHVPGKCLPTNYIISPDLFFKSTHCYSVFALCVWELGDPGLLPPLPSQVLLPAVLREVSHIGTKP